MEEKNEHVSDFVLLFQSHHKAHTKKNVCSLYIHTRSRPNDESAQERIKKTAIIHESKRKEQKNEKKTPSAQYTNAIRLAYNVLELGGK